MNIIDALLKGLAIGAICVWVVVSEMLMTVLPEMLHQLIIIAGQIHH